MPKAVKFNEYGDLDVLELVDVDMPKADNNQVVVRMKAAGINPGEDKIRDGSMHSMFPATFPSGEGTDLAGVITDIGPTVSKFKIGDEVAGYTHERASHADYIVALEKNLTLKPESVSWEVAGSLFVAATTAYASVKAVGVKAGDKVIVSAAAGGVGSIAAQMAKLMNAEVYGIVGDHDRDWLDSLGITPISYEGDVKKNIQAVCPEPDVFIDTVGHDYVKLAIEMGVDKQRINTVVDFAAAQEYGVKAEGSAAAASIDVIAELLQQIADNQIEVPIAKTFPLEDVKDAYKYLRDEHHRGKIVLIS
jgi:NADPH:quinone reductase-like Zn-dependent oxidoreductase